MTGWPSLCAAATNAGSSSIWAKKLFAGTTISVSLELPVTYAPYSWPRSIARHRRGLVRVPDRVQRDLRCHRGNDLDGPTTPKGIFRGTSNCSALTRHSTNRAWPTSTATSATTAFLVTSRLPGSGARRCRRSQLLSQWPAPPRHVRTVQAPLLTPPLGQRRSTGTTRTGSPPTQQRANDATTSTLPTMTPSQHQPHAPIIETGRTRRIPPCG